MLRVVCLLTAGFMTVSAAHAADFSKAFVDDSGKPACTVDAKAECPEDKLINLRWIARFALTATFEDEKNLAAEEKYRRGDLADTIKPGGEIKLKSEDVVLLKKVIGKAFGPALVKWAWDELEGRK